MSYKLFDQGYSAAEIRQMHKPTQDEIIMEQLRKWKESEHILNILRTAKASQEAFTEMEMKAWRKATKRK